MSFRPCIALIRSGPDGVDVYQEEMARLTPTSKKRLSWTSVETLRDDKGEMYGCVITVNQDKKPVTIVGYTDEPEDP